SNELLDRVVCLRLRGIPKCRAAKNRDAAEMIRTTKTTCLHDSSVNAACAGQPRTNTLGHPRMDWERAAQRAVCKNHTCRAFLALSAIVRAAPRRKDPKIHQKRTSRHACAIFATVPGAAPVPKSCAVRVLR